MVSVSMTHIQIYICISNLSNSSYLKCFSYSGIFLFLSDNFCPVLGVLSPLKFNIIPGMIKSTILQCFFYFLCCSFSLCLSPFLPSCGLITFFSCNSSLSLPLAFKLYHLNTILVVAQEIALWIFNLDQSFLGPLH